MIFIVIYILLINVVTFFTFGVDKKRAFKDKRRIPEKVLMQMAVFGGSVGAYAGMQYFRHKTHKSTFYLGVPFIFLIEAAAIFILINQL